MKKIFTLLFSCNSLMVFAGGFQINTQGPVSTGMAGAFTGVANDASSVFYNPGALALNAKNSVMLGGSLIMPQSSFLSPYNGNVNQEKQLFTPFFGYATYKISDHLSAGLGVNTPFGLGTEWAESWEGKFITQKIDLTAISVQPTLSYKINDMLSVGAGFVYTRGAVEIRKAVPVSSSSSSYGGAELKGSGNGFGYNLGVMGKFGEDFSAGLNFRSSVNIDVEEGDAVFSNIPSSLTSNFPSPTKFNSELTLPYSLTLGLAYNFYERFLVTAEIGLTGWSSFDTLAFDFPSKASLNTRSPRKYEDVFVYRLGAQYTLSPKIAARAGVAYDTTPVQDGYVSPELPDADKVLGSVGMTFNATEKLGITASYTYENLMERVGTNKEANFTGTYKTIIHVIGVGVHYNFN